MEHAFDSVGPLTPTMWGFTAADVQEQASRLNLNFAGVAGEYNHPYTHPIVEAWHTHPVHTLGFNKRQFNVLRYGAVLDEAAGLVVVSAPGELVDSGTLVAQEYASLCNALLSDPEKASHPLLAEYTLLVYRCHKDSAGEPDQPELLFRLVFRNEAPQSKSPSLTEWDACFPVFRLRAVYVSSDLVYPHTSELARYRQSHPAYLTDTDGARIANPRVQEMLFRPPLVTLCDLWMKVLDGVVPPLPKSTRRDDLEAHTADVFFHTHQLLLNGTTTNGSTSASYTGYLGSEDTVVVGQTALSYRCNMDRQQLRVVVVPRTAASLRAWRDGEMDISYMRYKALQGRFLPGAEAEHAEPIRTSCVRMLLLPERRLLNLFDGRELCAFLPSQHEYAKPSVYRTEAAECLRLWVLKGLVLAELLHVHALFLELDPVVILSQCSSLLWAEAEDGASSNGPFMNGDNDHASTLFYLCSVVLETVEDFLQHSGVVWRVIVGVREDERIPDVSLCSVCEEVLTVLRVARLQAELARSATVASEACAQECLDGQAGAPGAVPHSTARSTPAYCTALVASLRGEGAHGPLATYEPNPVAAPLDPSRAFHVLRAAHQRELPAYIVKSAALRRVFLFDRDLFPIFTSLCGPHKDEVPVKTLVEVLQLKLNPSEAQKCSALWPFEHPLVPLDHCGVPYNTARLTAFVSTFIMKAFTHGPDSPEPSLNYVEFSMLMLHLARL